MKVKKNNVSLENKSEKPKLTLILGSGFSKEAGLPTTNDIPAMFLETPEKEKKELPHGVGDEISKILKNFWEKVFNYYEKNTLPSMEDHFTLLDLAANSGHHLGKYYNPRRLRAIRRMSIHRVFSLVTGGWKKSECIHKLFSELNKKFALSIITLNWDIVIERHLKKSKIEFYYPIETFKIAEKCAGEPWVHSGIQLIKMHGSTNWVYCDSCRRIFAGKISSTALIRKAFLEPEDFRLFDVRNDILNMIESLTADNNIRLCPLCGNIFAGRVATFSYRKAFSITQFQAIWERTHVALRGADTWLIVGYSMPEADFEFRHLLKSAQLARKKTENWSAKVILMKDEKAVNRYKGFFGLNDDNILQCGLNEWVDSGLGKFAGR